MMPFGIADAIFSTIDFPTIGKTAWYYMQLVVGELLKGKV
jgi:hypothetical protein